jgi:uncharacterized protein (TIGR02001 family)
VKVQVAHRALPELALYRFLTKASIAYRQGQKKGQVMKRVALSLVLVAGLATSSAMAADMATKAPPPPAPAPAASPWDVAITAALMTDYNFRGITQSDHRPSTQAGFELRYTQSPMWQYYAGISGESIDFPNHAAAEIDFYGGVRPTFDKLALDFGIWYYYYPGGTCYNSIVAGCQATLANGNVAKGDFSFYEFYAKATYTVNDNLALGIQEWYSPSVLNSGADGWYTVGNVTLTAPGTWFASGWGGYVSGDLGYWALGTSDNFYCTGAGVACGGQFPNGIPYTSYWNWDAGFGITYKAFTLDLRYYDSNLNKGDCNAFTSDYTAAGVASTAINPGGPGSSWCGAAYIAKLSFATNLSSIK